MNKGMNEWMNEWLIDWFIHSFTYLFMYLLIYQLFIHLFIYLYIYISIYLSIFLSNYLFIYLCMYLCIYVSTRPTWQGLTPSRLLYSSGVKRGENTVYIVYMFFVILTNIHWKKIVRDYPEYKWKKKSLLRYSRTNICLYIYLYYLSIPPNTIFLSYKSTYLDR